METVGLVVTVKLVASVVLLMINVAVGCALFGVGLFYLGRNGKQAQSDNGNDGNEANPLVAANQDSSL